MTSRNHHAPGARFFPLLRRAQAGEKDALKNLAEAQQHSAVQLNKLNELQNHAERMHSGSTPQSSRTLTNRHAFISKLSEAILQQRKQLTQAQNAVEHARQQWLLANHDTRRFERLIEKENLRAQLHANRRDQKEQDEIALRRRRFVHHMAGG